MRALAVALLVVCLGAVGSAHAQPWKVTKREWTEADERGFSDFVRAIGYSNCANTTECIRVPQNPFRKTDPKGMQFIADCADFPYMLRAYYAWKNGLPYAYVDGVSGRGGDMRKAKFANRPVSRRSVLGGSGPEVLASIHASVSSATYRTDASQTDGILSDFYSPKIQPGSIRPGTVVYDINGHVTMVYDVDADGRILVIDAHPDRTVSRGHYGPQFGQSPVRLGGGIKNWRPIKVVGGRIVVATNEQIPDFSLEQYTGNVPGTVGDGDTARFRYNNVELGFYEYVRVAISGGKSNYNPIYELRATMQTLCNDLKDRALFVALAIKDGIHRKPQPSRFPDNIYGTDNLEWETYSTPSRDARIKTAFSALYANLQRMLFFWQQRDPRIVYGGYDLKRDLQAMYEQEAEACSITYTNSAGRDITMNFTGLMNRLFTMSFDPYHCIELRWGATSPEELASCKDDRAKRRWYAAEQRLRNQIDRTYEARMSFSVDQLENKVTDSGVSEPPRTDVRDLINKIGERTPYVGMKPIGD